MVVPERALVFEVSGSIDRFDVAVQALGFNWLIEEELPDASVAEAELDGEQLMEDLADIPDESAPPKAQVMYMTMPTQESLSKLLAQWKAYKKEKLLGGKAPRGLAPLWNMFSCLLDLRTWSVRDRMDPSIARYVKAMLEEEPDREVLIEFNFWYRKDERQRDRAVATLDALLEQTGGARVDFVEIHEIGYQGALVRLPSAVALDMVQRSDASLARLDDVMSIRPQSAYVPNADRPQDANLRDLGDVPVLTGPCVAAILDGYPVAGHAALQGRLAVHEVDVRTADVPVSSRHHGTAMASLVLHGDLHKDQPALTRKVALIPVLTGDPQSPQESTPRNKLAIGVIHRALQAIVNADPQAQPDLRHVTIVNHSLGDTFAPFARRPSPWAALLDYYSFAHRLLFVISAGNIFSAFPLNQYGDAGEFEAAEAAEREAVIITSLEASKGQRGILSPAESINGLTVGAAHVDESPENFGAGIDPYPTQQMPNLASALGFGVNKSLKPDLLHAGGRFAVVASNVEGGGVTVSPNRSVRVGQLVAAPSTTGNLRHTTRMAGTSNAAALVTRAGVQLADAVDLAYAGDSTTWLNKRTRAVILKALLAHGSSWGDIGDTLEESFKHQENWQRRRDAIAKLLGYGNLDVTRVISGEDNRITLLADDEISHDERHEYRLPIPKAMLNNKELRTITMTLAWATPILPTTIDYRGVSLRLVSGTGKGDFWDGVERDKSTQPTITTCEKGTLVHVKLSGSSLLEAASAEGIFVCVQAMSRHRTLNKQPVPYALAITMEMAQSVRTGLYQEVQQAIAARAQQRDTVRAGRAA